MHENKCRSFLCNSVCSEGAFVAQHMPIAAQGNHCVVRQNFRGIMGVKLSYWAGCNLIRMDRGGIWLNLIILVFVTLKFTLITLVYKERAIPSRHFGSLGENFLVNTLTYAFIRSFSERIIHIPQLTFPEFHFQGWFPISVHLTKVSKFWIDAFNPKSCVVLVLGNN